MNTLKSKVMIGFVCFALGIGAVLLTQKFSEKHEMKIANIDSNHSIQFYNDDFFGKSNDPFEQMRKMRKQMLDQFDKPDEGGKIFDSWFGKRFGGGSVGEIKKREDKDFIYYDVAIKGLNKENLKVNVTNGQVAISGQAEQKSEENGSKSFSSSSFHRSFPVPPDADSSKVQMDQSMDLLTLKFPKTPLAHRSEPNMQQEQPKSI
jgi:HSP20 family molecular chaperone IbpA